MDMKYVLIATYVMFNGPTLDLLAFNQLYVFSTLQNCLNTRAYVPKSINSLGYNYSLVNSSCEAIHEGQMIATVPIR